MPYCPYCGAEYTPDANFCRKCGKKLPPAGEAIEAVKAVSIRSPEGFIISTTPIVPGYKVKRVLGIVTGLTARTRGVGGKIIAGIQSIFGGEVSAFTSEMEKARREAVERAREKAMKLGANAIIGLDFETSDLFGSIILISATGTAVIVEKEE